MQAKVKVKVTGNRALAAKGKKGKKKSNRVLVGHVDRRTHAQLQARAARLQRLKKQQLLLQKNKKGLGLRLGLGKAQAQAQGGRNALSNGGGLEPGSAATIQQKKKKKKKSSLLVKVRSTIALSVNKSPHAKNCFLVYGRILYSTSTF